MDSFLSFYNKIKDFIPFFTTITVFLLIFLREFFGERIKIHLVMFFGALFVVLTNSISLYDSFKAIDFEVIIFLASIFVVGESLFENGFLYSLSYRIFSRAKNLDSLLFLFIITMGFLSYFFMNDTIAIVGTFLAIYISKKFSIDTEAILLTLAYSVTLGSVPSPIGNPQNLVIASRIKEVSPFLPFTKYLFLPTFLNLILLYFIVKIAFKNRIDFSKKIFFEKEKYVKNRNFIISFLSVLLLILMILLKLILPLIFKNLKMPLFIIPIPSSLLILFFNQNRKHILKNLDYKTLVFFISMFILMKSLYLKEKPEFLFNFENIKISLNFIFSSSIILSQLISNVPFVILFLETFKNLDHRLLMSLAAGSTIAGNIFLLGAASNIIILQTAEKKGVKLKIFEFSKIGIPLTLVNILIYVLFFFIF
ncbi:MAG: SLC13 family permease [candidate division WOR-3 bacterium]